jgi:serine protease Do
MRSLFIACFTIVFIHIAATGSFAQGKTPAYDRETPVVRVYAKTHKAVVSISGQKTVTRSAWPQFDWPDMFDMRGPQVEQQVRVLGSGFVVHEDGYIVTNAHVVADVSQLKVVFSDGREFPAQIVSEDSGKDLAVLSLKNVTDLPFIEIGRSSDLMIGETVICIGNPLGYASTVTSGVVSAVGRDLQVSDDVWMRGLIQTDASINPGNSGGPLLNVNGELIGVNTAIRADAQNIGFAIPVDTLVENLSQMLVPEKLRRVRLGLTVGRTKTEGSQTGLVVDAVTKGSPAEQKGLAAGDLILQMDDQSVQNPIDFYIRMMHKEIDDPIRLTYARPSDPKSAKRTVELKLVSRPLPDGQLLARQMLQLQIQPMTADVARRFNFAGAYPILIVTDLESGGVAARAGVRSGDLILQVNNIAVRDVTEFSRVMEKVSQGDKVYLKILRIALGPMGQVERRYLVAIEAKASGGSI